MLLAYPMQFAFWNLCLIGKDLYFGVVHASVWVLFYRDHFHYWTIFEKD